MASPSSPDENIEDEVNDHADGQESIFLAQSRALVAAPTPTTLTPPAAPARTAAAALVVASGKCKWSRVNHNAVGNAEPSLQLARCNQPASEENPAAQPQVSRNQDTSARKKISKYFAPKAEKDSDVTEKSLSTRILQKSSGRLEDDSKQLATNKVLEDDEEDDDDFVAPSKRKTAVKPPPSKRLKASLNDDDEDERMDEDDKTPSKAAGRGRGRGRGGRGVGATPGGRGRGLAGRGFMNFGERKGPPHKGEKEIPEGATDCLAGLTFVISGTLDSLEREEASDLIKRYGGRVTGAISKKTSYLLADEDIGGVKSSKAKDLGVPFLTEDVLFDIIWKSKPAKVPVNKYEDSNSPEKLHKSQTKSSVVKVEKRAVDQVSAMDMSIASRSDKESASTNNQKAKVIDRGSLQWTEKYRPKNPNDIVGNQSMVKQLHDWLKSWEEQFLHPAKKGKGKKQSNGGPKKAVLLSGPPGIGKTTTAEVISQMLGLQAIEVNASDSRGKAGSKIEKGVGGSISNSIKELISNATLNHSDNRTKKSNAVLILDEVDGMSAGDRGGVADLIASIKISKIPIVCICNDRYSQKLKSLINHCLLLNFRKPTKQQMGKRLTEIARKEGLQAQECAMEELAERVHGDIRMALNHLQYISLSQSMVKYDDIQLRLNSTAKDEDISPFMAVDRLFGFNGGRLRMDERIDLSMSDPDLVPLIIQGERNFNRFAEWLGKYSTTNKNERLLESVHSHILASQQANVAREALRLDYLTLLLRQMTGPLKTMPKDKTVQKVVEFMDTYCLSQEDFDTLVELSKFKSHPNPMDGIQATVKSALTKAYKQGSSSRVIRSADLINIPGMKRTLKKRVAAILEPLDESLPEETGVASAEGDVELSSGAENDDELVPGDFKLKLDLQSDKKKGIQVQLDLKNNGNGSSARKVTARSKASGPAGKGCRDLRGKRKR